MAGNTVNDSWEQIRMGVSDVERLVVQKSYNLAMIKARQTLEIMVKNQMVRYDVHANDLSEAIDRLYDAHAISARTRDSYHQIRMLGNGAIHEGDNDPNNANTAYHLLSQEVYTFANSFRRSANAGRRSGNQRRQRQQSSGPDFDFSLIIKILIPIIAVLAIILVIKGLSGNKEEETTAAETVPIETEYQTQPETIPETLPPTEPETEAEVWVTTDYLNVRMQPSTDSDRYGVLDPGKEIEYIGDYDDSWAIIKYDGNEGYVSREFIKRQQ